MYESRDYTDTMRTTHVLGTVVRATASATAVPGLCGDVVVWLSAVRCAPACAALCEAVLCTLGAPSRSDACVSHARDNRTSTASATAVPGLCVEVVFWVCAVRYAPTCAALCEAVPCTLGVPPEFVARSEWSGYLRGRVVYTEMQPVHTKSWHLAK